jgi:thiosulfate/3-mercaptopyruvate sulfurtransferase
MWPEEFKCYHFGIFNQTRFIHMSYANPNYLISTESLSRAMDSEPEQLRIFDVTVTLVPNPPGYKAVSGLSDYQKGHIPSASFLDLPKDFSDPDSEFNFMMPSAEYLQAAYRKMGINDDSKVVFYSTGHPMWATRAWWMLHSSGHKNVTVLDGGFAKWSEEGREVSTEILVIQPGNFTVQLDSTLWADKARTFASISDSDTCTINALSPGVYSGEADMNYGRKGHIENSMNIFYEEVLENGCFRSAEELRALFSDRGVLDKRQVIAYCGGGISATIDALALKLIGYENVSVYDGSMGEWVKDESLPLVTGSE